MAQILKSLRGGRAGFTDGGRLLSKKGFLSGDHGSQFSLIHPDRIVFFDDFLGDVAADEWNFTEGTDSSTSDGAISEGVNGVFLLTAGDSAGTVAADYAQLNSALNWKANQGGLVLQTRIKLASIASVSTFIGFTDTKSLEEPMYSAGSADTFTSDATDAVGFMFDTAMTTAKWWAVGVKNDTDATSVTIKDLAAATIAPVADTYEVFRIEIDSSGNAVFYRNGVECARIANALTATVALTPHWGIRPKSAAAGKTMSIDYALISALRV